MKNEIEKLLKPGELSIDGFLGKDDRDIDDIIAQDKKTFAELKITPQQAASRLEKLQLEGKDILEREKKIENRYAITVRDDRGPMPDPFGGKPLRKGDTILKDSKTGIILTWNALTIHMLKDYTFCSGIGSPYRLDPNNLKRVLF